MNGLNEDLVPLEQNTIVNGQTLNDFEIDADLSTSHGVLNTPVFPAQELSLAEIACIADMFTKDLRILHWNSCGVHFDFQHDLADTMYSKCRWDADYFHEKCQAQMPRAERIDETQLSYQWPGLSRTDSFEFDAFCNKLDKLGKAYIEAIQLARINKPSEIQSRIDDILDYWTNEINYKNKQRLKTF